MWPMVVMAVITVGIEIYRQVSAHNQAKAAANEQARAVARSAKMESHANYTKAVRDVQVANRGLASGMRELAVARLEQNDPDFKKKHTPWHKAGGTQTQPTPNQVTQVFQGTLTHRNYGRTVG